MPNTIQPREYSKGSGADSTPYVFVRNRDNRNLNVPYLYENGDKVVLNWNWLDNDWNSNNPALRFRNSLHFSPAFAGEFCFASWPFHPPIILPMLVIFSEIATYCLFLSDPDSQRTINIILRVSNLRMAKRT